MLPLKLHQIKLLTKLTILLFWKLLFIQVQCIIYILGFAKDFEICILSDCYDFHCQSLLFIMHPYRLKMAFNIFTVVHRDTANASVYTHGQLDM